MINVNQRVRAAHRALAGATTAVLLTSLAACGGDGSADGAGGKTVAALMAETTDNPYSAAFITRLKKLTEQKGIDVRIYNSKFDAATQSTQATSALAQHPDLVMLWPANPAAARTILLDAQKAGVPVQIENSGLSEEDAPADLYKAYVGPDDTKIGNLQAELTNDVLGGKGRVVMIGGQPASSVDILRTDGYRDTLEEIAPDIKILDSQPGFWDAAKSQSVMSEFLTRYGNDIDGVYVSDGIVASGAVKALQDAGIRKGKIKVFSAGGNKLDLPLVKNGWVAGTVFQSPVSEATEAAEIMDKLLAGEDVEKVNHIPLPVVTQSNVDEFQAEW